MYSKANYRDKNDIIIPENYRGNAFSGRIVAEESPMPSAIEDVTQSPSDETAVTVEAAETVSKPASSTFLSSLLPPKVSNPSGLLSNIGLEEMLIVGVLILLSQSETDDDILLLLFLLLFYK